MGKGSVQVRMREAIRGMAEGFEVLGVTVSSGGTYLMRDIECEADHLAGIDHVTKKVILVAYGQVAAVTPFTSAKRKKAQRGNVDT